MEDLPNPLDLQSVSDSANPESVIDTIFSSIGHTNPNDLLRKAEVIHNTFLVNKSYDLISKNMSLMGLLKYLISSNNYKTAVKLLNDSKFLASNAQNKDAKSINYFCFGYINYCEKNYDTAVNYLTKVLYAPTSIDYINQTAEDLLKKSESMKGIVPLSESVEIEKSFNALLNIARTLSAETGINNLLRTVAEEVKKVLNADRCTVFLQDKITHELWSVVALGLNSQEIRFNDDKGLAGYVLKSGQIINIKDAYGDPRFNKNIDIETGYKTQNVLCMPIWNMKHEILGVFQVLNKLNGEFNAIDEETLLTIGSSVGIAIENSRLFEAQQKMISEQKQMFASFIDTLSASIDARDKITAGHSSRVKMYSDLISHVMELHDDLRANIIHAAILHDIGKIGIRDAVLQKEGKLTPEEYAHIQEHVKITYDILTKVYLSDQFKEVAEIASSHHEKYDGSGYFRKLKGEEIHIGGRILAVGDVFDAITSKRHYREKMPIKDALDIIKSGSDKHFDANVVNAFFKIKIDRLVEVFLSEVDSVLDDNAKIIFSKYNVEYLYSLLNKPEESLSEEESQFIEIFNKYYNCKAGK